jgi:hypothetical protein
MVKTVELLVHHGEDSRAQAPTGETRSGLEALGGGVMSGAAHLTQRQPA